VSAARPPTPPAAGAPTVHAPGGRPARPPAVLQMTDDDDRCQRAEQYWPIRRASNNIHNVTEDLLHSTNQTRMVVHMYIMTENDPFFFVSLCRENAFYYFLKGKFP